VSASYRWGSVELLREETKFTPLSYTWSINHTSLCEHSKTVIAKEEIG